MAGAGIHSHPRSALHASDAAGLALPYCLVEPSKVDAQESGGNEWRWVVTDEKQIVPEHRMPPFAGLVGRMIVSFLAPDSKQQSGFLTWDDMGKWQRDLAVGRRDPTQEIHRRSWP